MDRLRCLLCGTTFAAASPEAMQVKVAAHLKESMHKGIALQRVRL